MGGLVGRFSSRGLCRWCAGSARGGEGEGGEGVVEGGGLKDDGYGHEVIFRACVVGGMGPMGRMGLIGRGRGVLRAEAVNVTRGVRGRAVVRWVRGGSGWAGCFYDECAARAPLLTRGDAIARETHVMKRVSRKAGVERGGSGAARAGKAKSGVSGALKKWPAAEESQRGAGDWRVATLERVRALIVEAVPGMIEERKWKKPSNGMVGIPVWSHPSAGMVCTGETYAKVVKVTFAKGAALADPSRLFNASLAGGTRRAIDIREGESVDAGAFKALVKAAVRVSGGGGGGGGEAASRKARAAKPAASGAARKEGAVKLLSGGNPQIAKADGDAPVQAYIRAMSGGGPGWKRDLGRRLDAVIERAVPVVRKAVRWNSPFYGVEGKGWFLSFHVLTKYVKVTFFDGLSLRPVPPGGTEKSKNARWIDIYEGDALDEAQMAAWVKQAAALPGWVP